MQALERRMRLAYLRRAEGQSWEAQGRRLTDAELRRVVERMPD